MTYASLALSCVTHFLILANFPAFALVFALLCCLVLEEATYKRDADGPVGCTFAAIGFHLTARKRIPRSVWTFVQKSVLWRRTRTVEEFESMVGAAPAPTDSSVAQETSTEVSSSSRSKPRKAPRKVNNELKQTDHPSAGAVDGGSGGGNRTRSSSGGGGGS